MINCGTLYLNRYVEHHVLKSELLYPSEPLYPANWTIAMHNCMACLKGWCVMCSRSRTPPCDL